MLNKCLCVLRLSLSLVRIIIRVSFTKHETILSIQTNDGISECSIWNMKEEPLYV